jgi:hypothetical protein
MHPETSWQLAAERLADFHRRADALALAGRRPASRKRRLRDAIRVAAPKLTRPAAR